ncbi:MAG: hypothetical protein ACI9HK_004242 [Pirellulaceae bacterium]|jgi:hypothetical protein
MPDYLRLAYGLIAGLILKPGIQVQFGPAICWHSRKDRHAKVVEFTEKCQKQHHF